MKLPAKFSVQVQSSIALGAVFLVLQALHGANPTAVKTVAPQKTALKMTTAQPATVRAFHEAELYAKVSGFLKELKADIGDTVVTGQVLAVIDVPEMEKAFERQGAEHALLERKKEQTEAAVGAAKAELEAHQSEYERVKSLAETKTLPQRAADESRSRFESAKAKLIVAETEVKVGEASVLASQKVLEEMEVLMDYASIKAPFGGVVTQRSVDPGDLVRNQAGSAAQGKPLFTVSQVKMMRVSVMVPEKDSVWVDVNDAAEMTFPALPGETFTGKVARTSRSLDPKTRTMEVEIDFENEKGRLLPGMYAKVVILMQERTALVVPSGSIRFDETGESSVVYVVKGGTSISHVSVTTGRDDGNHIEIVSGLTGDERIVTGMLGRLQDGQAVKVLSN